MANRIDPNQLPKVPFRPAAPQDPRLQPGGPGKTQGTQGSAAPSFGSVLQQTIERDSLKFSAHAQERLQASQTQLSAGDIARINDAVTKAAQKGARESLVLLPNMALVVSVRNRTVITAVDGQRMKDNIFTNIDSAVIL